MAIGKNPRPGKRSSSSSSYISTITTVGFVALCVLGVWMLTSSSVVPSQSTKIATGSLSSSRFSTKSLSDDDDDSKILSALGRKSGRSGEDQDENVQISAVEPESSKDEGEDKDQTGEDDRGKEKEGEVVKGEEEHKKSMPQETHQEIQHSDQTGEETESNQQTQQGEGGENDGKKRDLEQQSQQEARGDSDGNQQQLEQQMQQAQQEARKENEENQQQLQQVQQSRQEVTGESEENQQLLEQQMEKSQQEGRGESIENQQQLEQQRQQSQQQVGGESEQNQSYDNQQQLEKQTQQSQQQVGGEIEENQQQLEQHLQQTQGVRDDTQKQDQSQEHIELERNDQQQDQLQQKEQSEKDESQQQYEHDGMNENGQISQQNINEEIKEENQQQNQLSEESNTPLHNEGSASFPNADKAEIGKGRKAGKGSFSTQADQSQNEKDRRQGLSAIYGYTWELCNVSAGADYIPCLDNEKFLKKLHTTGHYEHRERHCPEEGPSCLVPLPVGYKQSIEWPQSRDKIWYKNVPHSMLAEVKGHQNWMKVAGEHLIFPGGGTQFIHGALHYIDFIQQAVPKIAWGKHTRVILDVGCGVASFGGSLFERDVLAMSFAPKDEHEAQVQFALERGIPAISAVMGTQRLPFPSRVFDIVHCARCRVPWHVEGGTLLLELNRVLRPGGYFVWSATPVYQKLKEDVEIWNEMKSLTASICWDLITIKKDGLNSAGAAIYRKPVSNECYKNRKHNKPPMCKGDDDPNAAWYVPLQTCMHKVPISSVERGSRWPQDWPRRLQVPPYWLNNTQVGVYGKPAPADFVADYEHWKRVVSKSYLSGLGISWSNVRNVMDMRAVYGGFAAALNDLKVWVMNVVNVDSPDTLPVIYERGLFGIYHDWCESFSTYPRTYDLLHADHLFSTLKKRCKIAPVMAEVDRIVRPGGKLIVRDDSSIVGEVENLLKSMRWEVRLTYTKNQVAILSAQKSNWRPEMYTAHF